MNNCSHSPDKSRKNDGQNATTDSESNGPPGRCKSLFGCCLKIRTRKRSASVLHHNPDKYDYVVEKFAVKRVPIAFFAVTCPNNQLNASTSSNTVAAPSAENKVIHSFRTSSQPKPAGNNVITERSQSKHLRSFHDGTTASHQDNIPAFLTDYDEYMKQRLPKMNSFNALTAYHPHSKESERERKDANDSTRWGRKHSNPVVNEQRHYPKADQAQDVLGRRHIASKLKRRNCMVSPVKIEHTPRNVIDMIGFNGQTIISETAASLKNTCNFQTADTTAAFRWKLTIKYCDSNLLHCSHSPKDRTDNEHIQTF